ncbi:helix-turn-helix protein [Dyadobacter jejuensis]|uniref:Helix-turn-helix protein n=1 Tax=Dyadobacter jejuensis TaxID=1082580 RepID=A0A316B6S1_9BACT|nr:helix-turn-helix domain-containing protein [Dyadobacter jejuensis]PWJ58247.1 helix-turn-helix protein [Dyadobacter jejuensis]
MSKLLETNISRKQISDDLVVFTAHDAEYILEPNVPFRAEAFALIVVETGELQVQSNLKNYTLLPQSILIVLPDSLNELKYQSEDLNFICLAFQKRYIEKLGLIMSSSEAVLMFSKDVQHHFQLSAMDHADIVYGISVLARKINMNRETPFYDELVKSTFLSVTYQVASIFFTQLPVLNVQLSRKEEIASKFLGLLAEKFRQERSVSYYANVLAITTRHLSQVLKEVTGKTAGELIDELVIQEARVLLSQSSINVAAAAQILQFSNQSFFGKYFKQHTGYSPSEYRSLSRTTLNPPF